MEFFFFFNTASSIALVVWQMQRQFFKHLRVNSHLICVSWVKGLDQSGWWKFKSEAEMKLINALCLTSIITSHAQCQVSWIGDTFAFTRVPWASNVPSKFRKDLANIPKTHCERIYTRCTCSFMIKRWSIGTSRVRWKKQMCSECVRETVFIFLFCHAVTV